MRKLVIITVLLLATAVFAKMYLADDIAPKNAAFNVMVDMRYIGDGDLDTSADADYNHYLDLAYGGLNADTTSYDGILKISEGVLSSVTDNSDTWNQVTGGDMTTAVYDIDVDGDIDVTAGGTEKSAWTQYCIPYLSTTTAFSEITIGSANQYLKVNSGATGYGFDSLTHADVTFTGWTGVSSITTLGTIATGVWNGTDIDISDYTNLAVTSPVTLTGDTLSLGDITLGTGTAGNYVATIADAGNTTITVTGSGSEAATITLDVVNVADADFGDVVVSSGSWSLDTDTVAVAEFLGSQDWGDMSTAANGTVSLDNDVVNTAEMGNGDYGDFSFNNGVASIDADAVLLTTDTTGNYVASITNGSGITGGDGGSEGAALTLAATLGTDIAAAEIANGDHGDFTYSSGTATLDANTVAASEIRNADYGDFTFSYGVATLDYNTVSGDELADGDYGGFDISYGTATVDDDFLINSGNDTMMGDLAVNDVNITGALIITGSADGVQLTITENSSQTTNVFVVEKSDGTDLFDISSSGAVDIFHTSTEADDHALEIDSNAAGFGDVKAIDIAYVTGAISAGEDEGIILINIDELAATGGDVFGLEVLATEGSAGIYGMKVGVIIGPIHQDSGVFADPCTGTDNVTSEPNMIDGNSVTITTIFESNGEYILIGSAAVFEEMEFILTVGSSGAGIKPTFGYSKAGSHTFTAFTPVDGTNGFRNTGLIAWDASDLSSHGINTDTGTYDIKITRTRNSLGTTPVLGYAKTAATTEYVWDKDGVLTIRDVNIADELVVIGDANIYGTLTVPDVDFGGGELDDVTIGTNSACTELQVDSINLDGSTITFSPNPSTITNAGGEGSDLTIIAGDALILNPSSNTTIQSNLSVAGTTTLHGVTLLDGTNAAQFKVQRDGGGIVIFQVDSSNANRAVGINKAPATNRTLDVINNADSPLQCFFTAYAGNYTSNSFVGTQTGDVTWVIMGGFPAAGDFTFREAGVNNWLKVTKTTGSVAMIGAYDETVGGTNIPLFMDNTGKIGAEPSGLKHKENIRPITDTESIYDLNCILYDRKDGSGEDLIGLIAEEVALIMPKAVGYKREIDYYMDMNEPEGHRRKVKEIRTTDIPETVNYSRLIVPMLKEIQKLRARVTELEKK